MINTIEKSFQRLSWRLTNGQFNPNQNDLDALKFIAEWVNREKEEKINENRYFGKMVVYAYIHLLVFWEGDNHAAEREIQEILEKPLEHLYYRFMRHMNNKEWTDATNSLGITNERLSLTEKNKALFKEHEEHLIMSIDTWSQEEINKKLNNFITELLNKYSNLP